MLRFSEHSNPFEDVSVVLFIVLKSLSSKRGPNSQEDCAFMGRTHSPTVKDVHVVDCLQMAMQSRVTADSGCARRPREEQLSSPSHMTVVPEVFS